MGPVLLNWFVHRIITSTGEGLDLESNAQLQIYKPCNHIVLVYQVMNNLLIPSWHTETFPWEHMIHMPYLPYALSSLKHQTPRLPAYELQTHV